ncbi:MAG: hypothetical protein JWP97_5400 [Labilithrix sp.]|nr:hypothetical protein [Labilithrix sp.]
MIEKSHGKARPALVRASDLKTVETDADRPAGRGPDGRFAPGNRVSVGSGCRRTQKKLLGRTGGSDDELLVRRDAFRVFTQTMRSMASDAAPVRSLVSLHARHVALAAYFGALASAKGLAEPEGMKLQEAADRQSQRAERVLVTAIDVARTLAAKGPTDKELEGAVRDAAKPRDRSVG